MSRIAGWCGLVVGVISLVMAIRIWRERDTYVRNAIAQHEARAVQRYMPLIHELNRKAGRTVIVEQPADVDAIVESLLIAIRRELAEAPADDGNVEAVDHFRSEVAGQLPDRDAPDLRSATMDEVTAVLPPPAEDEPASAVDEHDLDFVVAAKRGNSDSEIYVITDRGVEQLTHNTVHEATPVWSPDGLKIAFISHRDGYPDVYVMDRDGGNVRRITEGPGEEKRLTWMPDGERLAFAITDNHVDSVRTAALSSAPSAGEHFLDAEALAWSPQGDRMAFYLRVSGPAGQRGLIVADADGRNEQIIVPAAELGSLTGLCWSSDGKLLAFSHDRERGQVSTVNVAEGVVKPVLSREMGFKVMGWLPASNLLLGLYDDRQAFILDTSTAGAEPSRFQLPFQRTESLSLHNRIPSRFVNRP